MNQISLAEFPNAAIHTYSHVTLSHLCSCPFPLDIPGPGHHLQGPALFSFMAPPLSCGACCLPPTTDPFWSPASSGNIKKKNQKNQGHGSGTRENFLTLLILSELIS